MASGGAEDDVLLSLSAAGDRGTSISIGSIIMDEPSGTHQTKIEDFDILKTIGTGTFARVYLCKHKDNSADGGGKANARSTMGKENNANSNKNYYALKVLSMTDVIRLKQIEHVKSEKNILLEINHPFLVDMIWHYKDSKCLYMLFPYICGGELFSYLRSSGRFSANQALFYTAEIVSAFEYLHSKEIVYRDLKVSQVVFHLFSVSIPARSFASASSRT